MTDSLREKISRVFKVTIIISSVLGLASIIIEHGFYVNNLQKELLHLTTIIVISVFVLYQSFSLFTVKNKLAYLKVRKYEFLLTFLILFEIILYFFDLSIIGWISRKLHVRNPALLYIVAVQAIVVLEIVLGALRYNKLLLGMRVDPARLFVFSFLITIILGTLFLMLPRATTSGHISLVDALFTSTSAVCVTGLSTLDTAVYFTRFGQSVILVLAQIGGLGLITFTTFFSLFLAGGLGLRETVQLNDILGETNFSTVTRILSKLIIITLLIEFIGAVILYFSISSSYNSFGEAAFSAVFHSVMAFCNAGFSIYSLNLYDPYIRDNYVFTTTVAILIMVGGIGFPTLINLFSSSFSGTVPQKLKNRISLQTKLIILVTILLLSLGTVLTYILEYNNSLKELTEFGKIHAAFFQSVTSRTAGFNTVDITQFSTSTTLLYFFLMFVGASPGGTGGGIKTTTFAIIFLGFWAFIRKSHNVHFGRRSIPSAVITRALLKTVFSFFIILTGIFFLTITESSRLLADLSFEAFSAFGTVGLSKALTPSLSHGGKIIIMVLMFIGRIGPLNFTFSLIKQKKDVKFDYPSENISTV